MKRLLATFSVLIAVALASTGCNVSSTPSIAARVNVSTITTATLDGVMGALKADTALLCASHLGTHPVTTGPGTGTWNSTFAGYVLEQLIKFEVLQQLVAAHHLYVPATDLTVVKTEAESALAAAGATGCPGTPATAVDDAGTVFETAYLRNQLYQDAYAAYLAGTSLRPAALASWEQTHETATSESCTSVIELTSHSLAVKVERAIRKGASFGGEADSNNPSNSTGKAGAIGCILAQSLVGNLGPVVAALRVGVVSPPVSYQSGWLLFSVTKRVPEPLAGLLPLLEQSEGTAFNTQYGKALADAHITVSPVYGTWTRTVSSAGVEVAIVPPSSKACAYALSEIAAGCVTTTTAAPTGSAAG